MASSANIEITHDPGSMGYILRAVVDEINARTLEEIAKQVPKLVAEQYVKDHMQEIMEKVNATEVASCIAAAVAQKVADAYKPKGD